MGVMAVDVENDGDLDLFLTHLHNESNTLYRKDGSFFEDVTVRLGLATPSLPFTGFGLGFADFDHDGLLDVFIANGRVERYERAYDSADRYAEPNQLFRGNEDGRFTETASYLKNTESPMGNSRGAAFGDLDNDGDIDVVVVNIGGPAIVLRNCAGSRGAWVMFRILNKQGGNAIGANVGVTAGGRQQWRSVQTAYSYCASNDPRVHFGLGSATTVEEVLVRWPGENTERFGPFAVGELHELAEGHGHRP